MTGRANRADPFLVRYRRLLERDMPRNVAFREGFPDCPSDHEQLVSLTSQVNRLHLALLHLLDPDTPEHRET